MQKAFTSSEFSKLICHCQLLAALFQRAANAMMRWAIARRRLTCGSLSLTSAFLSFASRSNWVYCSLDFSLKFSPPAKRRVFDSGRTLMPSCTVACWAKTGSGASAVAAHRLAASTVKEARRLNGCRVMSPPWSNFWQHHHGRESQKEADDKKREPAQFRDQEAHRGIDQGARHGAEAGKQRILRGRVARVRAARQERDKGRRAQSQARKRFKADHGTEQDGVRPHMRQPGKTQDGASLQGAKHPQAPVDAQLEHPHAAHDAAGQAGPETGGVGSQADLRHAETQVQIKLRRQRGGHAVADFIQ